MQKYMDYIQKKREYYENMLKIVGSLSRLFSESEIPYLDSRVAENLYCKALGAENKSRDDSAIDAVFDKTGVGINLVAKVENNANAEQNKKYYILRILHNGKIKVFKNNPDNIGFAVDSNGKVIFE